MTIAAQTRELLLSLARNIIDVDSRDALIQCDNLRNLHSFLPRAVRSVAIAQNELSLINKLPPETLANISEFVVEPRTRESMFEIVKLTHICQYWRSTLISYPHLWSSIFVGNDHKDFVYTCLERSRELPLVVRLDLENSGHDDYLNWIDYSQRIRTLDVHFAMHDDPGGVALMGKDSLIHSPLFVSPLPALESLSLHVDPNYDIDPHLELPEYFFSWRFSPPTKLCHLALHGCYGGPILAVRNLTSLDLAGNLYIVNRMELDQHTFLPIISGSPSLVSLSLSHCEFPDRTQLSRVVPVKLPELKSLRLMDFCGFPGFPSLIEVPAFEALSSLRISTHWCSDFLVHAESADGFQLSYDAVSIDGLASDWLDVMYNADPSPAFVRFEGREVDLKGWGRYAAPPLFLLVNAKVLEIGASFVKLWCSDFRKDLGEAGPHLNTLRLEVTEGMNFAIAKSVEKLVMERFNKGMPLERLERMRFEGMSEEVEEKAEMLWAEFRAGLDINQYLSPL